MPELNHFSVLSEYSISMQHFDDAEDMFVIAKNRLFNIYDWHLTAGLTEAAFQIVDIHGHEIRRNAHKNDMVKLEQGNSATVFMSVTAIVYDDYPDANTETISMELAPVASLTNDELGHLHPEIIILLKRHGITVAASIASNSEPPVVLKNFPWDKFLEGLLDVAEA